MNLITTKMTIFKQQLIFKNQVHSEQNHQMKHDIEVSVFIIKEIKFLFMNVEEQFNLIL